MFKIIPTLNLKCLKFYKDDERLNRISLHLLVFVLVAVATDRNSIETIAREL